MLILLVVAVIWPLYSFTFWRRFDVGQLRTDAEFRKKFYCETIITLWVIAGAIALTWIVYDRPFAALGFQHSLDLQTSAAWVIAAVFILYSTVQLYRVHNDENARREIATRLDDVGEQAKLLMPKTAQEHRWAMAVGVTAGVAEEVIFRGYLVWAFGLFLPVWVAGVLSIAIFVLLHLYQERGGIVQVTVFAAIATLLFLACGSLWPLIVMHVGVDILNLSIGRKISEYRTSQPNI